MLNTVLRGHRGRCGLPLHLVGSQLTLDWAIEVLALETTMTAASPIAEPTILDGATVVAVATIADRNTGAAEVFAEHGLEYRHVYGLADLGLA